MENVITLGLYRGSLRRLALRVKDGRESALRRAAAMMAKRLPDGAVVVPMPGHGGRATAMLYVANYIGLVRPDVTVRDSLEAEPHPSNYALKKIGRRFLARFGMRVREPLEGLDNVFIIDNVIDSGLTFRAASAAIPGAKLLTIASTTKQEEK